MRHFAAINCRIAKGLFDLVGGGEQAAQEAFLNAWLTLRAIGSALSAAVFCPSAVSSLVCSIKRALLSDGGTNVAISPHHREPHHRYCWLR